jgi:uncharacterized oligopeptide transporter (OPT) family protein
MNWPWFGMGIAFAVGCIVFNKVQEGRDSTLQIPIMAVAIGIYLPLTLAVSIMLGGAIKLATQRYIMGLPVPGENDPGADPEELDSIRDSRWENTESRGILFSSGLIAGEALMGVIIAAIVLMGYELYMVGVPAAWPGILLFLYIAFLLGYMSLREQVADLDGDSMLSGLKRMK